MSKKNKKQSPTMVDNDSLRYRNGEGKEDIFDRIDYEVSSILLELSYPVLSSSDSPFLHKWGRTRKRSTSVFHHPSKISPEPVIKSPPVTEVGEMGSTSSSSCLTGEAKKTNSHTTIQVEMGLIRSQVGLVVAEPIADSKRERDYQNLRHLQPLMCLDRTVYMRDVETSSCGGFDLNLPAAAEESNGMAMVVDFQRVATKVQAAAQARQRRLALIRSKKLYARFISPYQQFK